MLSRAKPLAHLKVLSITLEGFKTWEALIGKRKVLFIVHKCNYLLKKAGNQHRFK